MYSPTPLQFWAWLCLLYLKLWFFCPHSEPSCIHINRSSYLSCSDSRSCGCLCFKLLSRVWLSVTSWTVARQTPLSMGILQARILKWVAMRSSRGSSQPRDQTQVSLIAGGLFTVWATREAHQGNWFLGHLHSHTCPLLWPLLRADLASVCTWPLLAPLAPTLWLTAVLGGVSVMTDLLFLLHLEYPPYTCRFSES